MWIDFNQTFCRHCMAEKIRVVLIHDFQSKSIDKSEQQNELQDIQDQINRLEAVVAH